MNTNINDVIYITGHRNPDSDSIVSALAYANLKQKMNINAIACRLGDINAETKYLLDRFKVREPMLLHDARSQLDEIEMDPPLKGRPETTIMEALNIMNQSTTKNPVLAVVNDLDQLQGIITSSNFSGLLLGDTAKSIDILSRTPIEYIAKTIDGKLIYAPEVQRCNGKTSIIAISASKLENYEITDRIVIVGNDTDAQLDCIAKNAAMIIVVWANNVAPMVIEAAKQKGCGIIISGHGTMNTSRYLFYSSPIKEIMTTELVLFNKAEFVEDVGKKMIRSRHRSYPVVDDQNHIFGFISRYHILNSTNKKVILVDHNEMRQSVPGIEQAELLEIVDHHRIGDVSTAKPIMFRNEIVGSTATLITKLYLENQIPIEKKYAALLLGAMISDTLNFRSPTTTNTDVAIATKLALIAELDIEQFAKDIFMVSNSLKGQSMESILDYDKKEFNISNKRVVVSQMILYQLNEVQGIEDKLLEVMNKMAQERKLDLWVMVFTSIHDNGSVFYGVGRLAHVIEEAFPNVPGETNSFIDNVVSRKNQIIPKLTVAINMAGI